MSCCKTYDPCRSNNLNQVGSYASTAGQYAQQAQQSATNAATSATQASTAQAEAEQYAIQAAASAAISGIYLGAKSTAPVVDNQGNPLQEGMQYFNSVDNTMYVWDGTSWITATGFNETTNFLATGTTTARDLQERFADVVNVLDFGADPTGAFDSTQEIQDAITAANGSSVFIPSGTYKVTGIITGDFYTFGTVTITGGDIDYVSNLSQIEVIDFNKNPIYRKYSEYIPTSNKKWAFAHTGQSLAEGGVGNDPVSGLIPYPNTINMLNGGPVGLSTYVIGPSIQTLAEKNRVTIASSYMRKILNSISSISENVFFHGQAWGGKNYQSLKKGGTSGVYEKIIAQAQTISTQNVIYKGISVIHGEQDGLDNNTNYAANLNEWKTDFNVDLKTASGQIDNIPMFLCQVGSSSGYNFIGGITTTGFPTQLEQLKAHETYNDIYLVCPKYQLDYYDHSHITNNAQVLLGEYYAKAFKKVIDTSTYDPLRPSTIVGFGNKITISFAGRVGNLVFDTTNVIAATNQGFAYNDDSGRTITNVQIINNEVVITLSGTIGANPVVSYAYNNGAGGAANQVAGLGARGNLRDSDTATSSFTGQNLYNWCVIFKKSI